MTGLKDLLKKKDKIGEDSPHAPAASGLKPAEFTFVRTTTESQEIVEPPDYPDAGPAPHEHDGGKERKKKENKHTLGFRKSANVAFTKDPTAQPAGAQELAVRSRDEHRLSHRLHLPSRSRSASAEPSAHLPGDLPDAPDSVALPVGEGAGGPGGKEEERQVQERREAQWEKRATMLAQGNPLLEQPPQAADAVADERESHRHNGGGGTRAGSKSPSPSPSVPDARGDVNIQEAIRLHEIGQLGLSTAMFGRLAEPEGANNALAQVLYGLALRHGWGQAAPEPARAVRYLSLAAANAAGVEAAALAAGLRRGGAAKGELVLAIFELANCFRHGWGVARDPVAARQYYETAANLGDTDAMDEAAWCYLEGFGGPKDKFRAAQYLRLAEEKGGKSVGNSWIWKDKYNPT